MKAYTVDRDNTLAHKRTAASLKRNKQTLFKSGLVAIAAVTLLLIHRGANFLASVGPRVPLKQLLLLKFHTLLGRKYLLLVQIFLVFKHAGASVLCRGFPSVGISADGCQVAFAYAYVAKLWPPYWSFS